MWNFKGILWNSTQNNLPIHWKIWLLYNIEILRFKSSYAFLNPHPTHLHPHPSPTQIVQLTCQNWAGAGMVLLVSDGFRSGYSILWHVYKDEMRPSFTVNISGLVKTCTTETTRLRGTSFSSFPRKINYLLEIGLSGCRLGGNTVRSFVYSSSNMKIWSR